MSTQKYSKEVSLDSILEEFSSPHSFMGNRLISARPDRSVRFGIDQVRHIFHFLYIRKQYIRCYFMDTHYEGIIVGLKENLAVFYVKGLAELNITSIHNFEIEFFYSNLRYQFDVFVSEIRGNYICIYIPDELQSTVRRETERVSVDDLFVRFTLAYPPFPNIPFRGISSMDPRFFGHLSSAIEELKKDEPRISLLHVELDKHIKRMGFSYDIEIFSHRPISEKQEAKPSIIEETLRTEKKIFFIEDSRRLESYFSPYESNSITNFQGIYEKLEKEKKGNGKSRCQEIQDKDTKDFIRSYICFPIMALDTVIGYMRVFSTVFDQRLISQEDIMDLEFLGQILSYGITKSTITQKYYKQINTRIRNISRGGLFFEIEDKETLDYLISHIYIVIVIEIEEEVLNMKARLTRYYIDKKTGKFGIGAQFYKRDPDTDKILANLVYEHKRNLLKAGLS